MDTNVLVGLLRLDLECRGFVETTIREYTRLAGMCLDEHHGVVEGVTRENVVGWINAGATRSRKRWRWLSLRSLSRALNEDGIIEEDPTARISMPQEIVTPQPIVSEADFAALIAACSGNAATDVRDRALILTLASTGARRAEIAALRVVDVDLDSGTVLIRNGKGGRARTAFLDSSSRRALVKWLHRSGIGDGDHLWPGQRGNPLTGDGVRQVLERRSRRAGVRVTAHQFRRRLAARWLLDGGSEVGLRAAAGWNSGAMVARYAAMAATEVARTEHTRIFG